MRIALPVADGSLCQHFGHCTHFALFEVDDTQRTITSRNDQPAPRHEPGVFPTWLGEQGVTVVIAGGMGGRARDMLVQQGMEVVVGAEPGDPASAVDAFLAGNLSTSPNFCEK
jgi:ATP-binding protein involved in chromosome partitioning